jgi:hypothetical protein
MLDGERGKMGIGYQICGGISFEEESPEDAPVIVCGLNDSDTGLLQPALNSIGGFSQRQRPPMKSRIGGDSKKCAENGPAETNCGAAAQSLIPPGSRSLVLLR